MANYRAIGASVAGLASGLQSGLKTADSLQNSAQARAHSQANMDYTQKMRGLHEQGYKNLFGLLTGAMTPEQFYKSQAQVYGFQLPNAPVQATGVTAAADNPSPSDPGYTQPGLSSVYGPE